MDASQLLIDGYVREIQEYINNKQIVPIEINRLISTFYRMLIRLFCFHANHGAYVAEINNGYPMKSVHWNCDIYSLSKSKDCTLDYAYMMNTGGKTSQGFYVRNIKLPPNINSQISKLQPITNKTQYDAIFTCYNKQIISMQQSTNCSALIYDSELFGASINKSS